MVGVAEKLPEALRDFCEMPDRFACGLFRRFTDSRFLCHAALLCHCDILAVHASGPHIPANETAYVRAFAKNAACP